MKASGARQGGRGNASLTRWSAGRAADRAALISVLQRKKSRSGAGSSGTGNAPPLVHDGVRAFREGGMDRRTMGVAALGLLAGGGLPQVGSPASDQAVARFYR